MKSPCPFVNYLEIEEVARENGTSRLVMPFREELTNPVGFMHGGAISSLADAGMAEALVSLLRHGNFFTARMEVRFKAPSKGETLICEAKIESSRGNFFFGKATVTGEKEGKVVAEAQATFRAAEQR